MGLHPLLRSTKRWLRKPVEALAHSYFSMLMKLQPSPSKYIVVMAHQRSGSTLLQHLLFGHDDIVGFGQNHRSYLSDADLDFVKRNTYWFRRQWTMPETHIVDKFVKYEQFSISDDYLSSPDFKFIFLVREPEPTILSIIQDDLDLFERSQRIYNTTLSRLEEYAEKINDSSRSLFITHQQLIEQSQSVLVALQSFLDLDTPLSESYPVLRTTGYGLFGDFTDRIKSGSIVKTPRQWDVSLPTEPLLQSQHLYLHCCEVLSQHCTTLV